MELTGSARTLPISPDDAGGPRPLVAVAYGARSVAAMQLARAAAEICDLVWLGDARVAEVEEMSPLLQRFGAVIDIGGLTVSAAAEKVAAFNPEGIVTYFDADMVEIAEIAAQLGLPFVTPEAARRLIDKLWQRGAL